MTRTFPCEPPSLETIPKQPEIVTKEYTIKIVTPMFGGGVKAGKNDPSMLIRPTSIRGHLRFWWRAMHGANHSVAEMRKAENAIWGSTEIPSSVGVRILSQPKYSDQTSKREPNNDFGFQRFGVEAYALFPAKSNGNSLFKEGGEFTIQFSYPKESTEKTFTQEVESAIWAWVNFGGIGARTRRGCGALFCNTETVFEIPQKLHAVFLGSQQNSAMLAWQKSVEVYKDFRQVEFRGPKHKKRIGNKEVMVPGRNKWPEPDSIRRLTGCSLKPQQGQHVEPVDDPAVNTHDHSTPLVSAELMPCFPRAVLGMPIEFHFADGPSQNSPTQSHKDPAKTRIFPKKLSGSQTYDRMSSPVITRPVFWDKKWYPAIIILHSPDDIEQMLSAGIEITGENVIPRNQNNVPDLKKDIPISGIVGPKFRKSIPMKDHDNAIDAFIYYAKSKGYSKITEVSR